MIFFLSFFLWCVVFAEDIAFLYKSDMAKHNEIVSAFSRAYATFEYASFLMEGKTPGDMFYAYGKRHSFDWVRHVISF